MARPAEQQPTPVEMAILEVLWKRGPSTLGSIHEAVLESRDVAYSTTRKMTQVMREKGLIDCQGTTRPLIYSAAKGREETRVDMAQDLLSRLFGGSAKDMMMSLLSAQAVSDEEMNELKRLIESERRKRRG